MRIAREGGKSRRVKCQGDRAKGPPRSRAGGRLVGGDAPSDDGQGTADRNIQAIRRIEKEDEQELLLHHRALHAVGRFVGTP